MRKKHRIIWVSDRRQSKFLAPFASSLVKSPGAPSLRHPFGMGPLEGGNADVEGMNNFNEALSGRVCSVQAHGAKRCPENLGISIAEAGRLSGEERP